MSYKQLFRLALCSVALLGATLASAQDTQADFASQTPLKLSGNGPWYRIELPLNVQLNSRQQDLGDLRIFNAQGQAQAYAIARSQVEPGQTQTPKTVKLFPLYSSADEFDRAPGIKVERSASGTLVEVQPQNGPAPDKQVLRGWLLDASTLKKPLQQLMLDWSTEHEGFQRFRIEASDDLQNWSAWGDGQVARLSFADQMVEQREVALPGRTARYLRLLWTSPSIAPALTSAQLVMVNTDTEALPLAWSEPVTGTLEKPGSYVWQLPAGVPVDRVKVDIAQPNSLAPARLYGRKDSKATWQPIGNGLLYRLTQNGEDVTQNEIQTSGDVIRQLKLEVDERGGGLGTQKPTLSFALSAPQVVFLARGSGPFTLAVGNPSAEPADLPLATLIPDYNAQKMSGLGNAEPESMAIKLLPATPAEATGVEWKRIGFWTVLVLGVILLGWMALSTLRAAPLTPGSATGNDDLPAAPMLFKATPSGDWEALEGYYRARLEGSRVGQIVHLHVNGKPQASLFAWSQSNHSVETPGYVWILGAQPEVGETQVGNHTYTSIFTALFKAISESETVSVVYDPAIRNTVLDRWGP